LWFGSSPSHWRTYENRRDMLGKWSFRCFKGISGQESTDDGKRSKALKKAIHSSMEVTPKSTMAKSERSISWGFLAGVPWWE